MSANPLFLNCRVRKADGDPIEGIQVRAFSLAQPDIVYFGRSNDRGVVSSWSRGSTDEPKLWLCCSDDSAWRFNFDVPDHAFPCTSIDFRVAGHADANVTLTIAPSTVALSNGSFEDIAARHNVSWPLDANHSSPPTGPLFVGRRDSSSLGSISDISSFSLDSETPFIRNVNSYETPVYYSQSPTAASEAGEITLEHRMDSPTLGFGGWDDWFSVQTNGEEEETQAHPGSSSRKRMHEAVDGRDHSADDAVAKRIKVSK
ncbi:unnamed protein product [Discula destructiva]